MVPGIKGQQQLSFQYIETMGISFDAEIFGVALVAFMIGVTTSYFIFERKAGTQARVNQLVKLELEKVVDTCHVGEIEDAGKKVMCRCWKSKKFPYCDGSHVQHNKETGDNVGPLILEK